MTDGIGKERLSTAGRVIAAGSVARERTRTVGSVKGAGCIAKKRERTRTCQFSPIKILLRLLCLPDLLDKRIDPRFV